MAEDNKSGRNSDGLAIKTVGLTKDFGGRTCVDSLDLAIRQGELYALLGDNGAGKTTTINMLTTLLEPTAGEYYICGHRGGGGGGREALKELFGIVSQDVAIYQELTAYENLKFIADLYAIPGEVAEERIRSLLAMADLSDRANDLAGEFSGGMQRKLSISVALLHEPKVLFMDEPTVGLDPASRRSIWQSLKKMRELGVTILLTTHYLEEAELLADRIGIIRQGKLVVEGTIEELRDKIRGMRGITIRLTDPVTGDKIEPQLAKLREKFGSEVWFDELRNTIHMSQPDDAGLLVSLQDVMVWLEEEKISFSRFATSEPNLEEVFLAISSESESAN